MCCASGMKLTALSGIAHLAPASPVPTMQLHMKSTKSNMASSPDSIVDIRVSSSTQHTRIAVSCPSAFVPHLSPPMRPFRSLDNNLLSTITVTQVCAGPSMISRFPPHMWRLHACNLLHVTTITHLQLAAQSKSIPSAMKLQPRPSPHSIPCSHRRSTHVRLSRYHHSCTSSQAGLVTLPCAPSAADVPSQRMAPVALHIIRSVSPMCSLLKCSVRHRSCGSVLH